MLYSQAEELAERKYFCIVSSKADILKERKSQKISGDSAESRNGSMYIQTEELFLCIFPGRVSFSGKIMQLFHKKPIPRP